MKEGAAQLTSDNPAEGISGTDSHSGQFRFGVQFGGIVWMAVAPSGKGPYVGNYGGCLLYTSQVSKLINENGS